MSKTNEWYEADTDLMGDGYSTCGHHHRTYEAAERCLPKVPRNNVGSLTQYFSMAIVRHMVEGQPERPLSTLCPESA